MTEQSIEISDTYRISMYLNIQQPRLNAFTFTKITTGHWQGVYPHMLKSKSWGIPDLKKFPAVKNLDIDRSSS